MGKYVDMISYYERVNNCCCFKSSISNERQNIVEKIITLQTILPPQFKFDIADENNFIEVYKEYRIWLLEKYMNKHYCFSSEYPNYYSKKYRKIFEVDNLLEIYGQNRVLFFTMTLNRFLSDYIDVNGGLADASLKKYNNDEKKCRVENTAHKMLLYTANIA